MKPLNHVLITRAHLRFLGNFCLLLLSLLVIIYCYFKTLVKQTKLVVDNKELYSQTIFRQRLLKQKMDTICLNLREMDQMIMPPGDLPYLRQSALDEQLVHKENLVLEEKRALDRVIEKTSHPQPHEVYRKLSGRIKELLLLKDSIATATRKVSDLKYQLADCRHPKAQAKTNSVR